MDIKKTVIIKTDNNDTGCCALDCLYLHNNAGGIPTYCDLYKAILHGTEFSKTRCGECNDYSFEV
jgi:hypothetical protein